MCHLISIFTSVLELEAILGSAANPMHPYCVTVLDHSDNVKLY